MVHFLEHPLKPIYIYVNFIYYGHLFLEAQLLFNKIHVTDSLTHGRLASSAIFPLLWIDLDVLYGFTTYDFITKPFYMISVVKIPG